MTFFALPSYDFLPAPLWLITALHVVTLALHVAAMNCLLGGLVVTLAAPLPNRWEHPLVERLVRLFPALMATTVTLGVAPLLFAQLVYGQVLYSAAILSAWFWLGIPAAAVLAYYCLYAAAFSPRRAGPRVRTYLVLALIGLLYISLTYSSVFSLAERPAAQGAYYAENADGTVWHPDVGAWIFRWLHMISGAVMIGGYFVALLGRRDERALAVGRSFFLGGMIVASALGVLYLLTLGDTLRPFMRSPGIWWLTASVVLALASLHFFFKRRFLPAGLVLGASLLGMVVARHELRGVRLADHLDPAATPVHPQWAVFAVFLVCFVAGLAVVAWMVRLFLRGRPDAMT